MTTYTIAQIEQAINVWRSRQQSGEDAALCAPARALATPYTTLILEHQVSINENELSAEQLDALRGAL
jgi:hypothetical protein